MLKNHFIYISVHTSINCDQNSCFHMVYLIIINIYSQFPYILSLQVRGPVTAGGAAMDVLAVSGIQLSPLKDFDQIVEIRAEKREHLRGRNNVTSCRSPTREFDTKQIKNELKEKRHLEFLRRRSVSPELCGSQSVSQSSKTKSSAKTFSMKHHSLSSKSETLYTNVQSTLTTNGHPVMILTPNSSKSDALSSSKWVNTRSLNII